MPRQTCGTWAPPTPPPIGGAPPPLPRVDRPRDAFARRVASRAARAALADAGLAVDDIDALIVATSTADLTFPSAATMVQDAPDMEGRDLG